MYGDVGFAMHHSMKDYKHLIAHLSKSFRDKHFKVQNLSLNITTQVAGPITLFEKLKQSCAGLPAGGATRVYDDDSHAPPHLVM